ncbi:hypothetical protein, partial [Streptomyces geysiriensis]|uniref:hypothetical protein n=1 Tax=Streptomyces geysiriensis TaxID=68207 RepID=UPI001C7CCA68
KNGMTVYRFMKDEAWPKPAGPRPLGRHLGRPVTPGRHLGRPVTPGVASAAVTPRVASAAP